MKFFKNKINILKFAIVMIVIVGCSLIIAPKVYAEEFTFGGILLAPVNALITGLTDGLVDIIHQTVIGQEETLLPIDLTSTWWEKWGGIIVGIAAGIAAIALCIVTAGAFAAVLAGLVAVKIGVTSLIVIGGVVGSIAGVWYSLEYLPQNFYLTMFNYSPEEIFKGQILLFDVDFFNPEDKIYAQIVDDDGGNSRQAKVEQGEEISLAETESIKYYFYEADEAGETDNPENHVITSKQNVALELQKIISEWYVSLRNVAIVLMLSILLYIGIRMMLTTVANDKAKFKQMLNDWFIGICLLAFMHFIMIFAVTAVKEFTNIINTNQDNIQYAVVISDLAASSNTTKDKLIEAIENAGMGDTIMEGSDGEPESIVWATNLMGKLRMESQMATGTANQIGYSIAYVVLVIFTIMFTFTYLKRVLYLAFLTLIAPLVAMTYPLDKLHDGQAQGFDSWLKEYIFNLLIQPIHLLLYTILVTSALELASTNILYMLVSIGFLLPAEKLLRSLFGFQKSSTAGSLAGAAVGASMLTSGINKLLKAPGKGGGNGKSGGNNTIGPGGNDNSNIRYNTDNNPEDILSGALAEASQEEEAPSALDLPQEGDENFIGPQRAQEPAQEGDENFIGPPRAQEPVQEDNQETIEQPREQEQTQEGDEDFIGPPRPPQPSPQQLSRFKRFLANRMKSLKGLKSAGKAYGRSMRRTFTSSVKSDFAGVGRGIGSGIASIPNLAARTAGAVGGAALGAGLGAIGTVASGGDAKYMGGTAALGASYGASMMRMEKPQTSGTSLAGFTESYRKGRDGDEYEEKKVEREYKKWIKDSDSQAELEKTLGIDQYDALKDNGELKKYHKSGISSKDEIKTIEKMKKKQIVQSTEEGIALRQMGQKMGDVTKMKDSEYKDTRKALVEKFKGTTHGDQAEQLADKTMKKLEKMYNL